MSISQNVSTLQDLVSKCETHQEANSVSSASVIHYNDEEELYQVVNTTTGKVLFDGSFDSVEEYLQNMSRTDW